MTMFFIIIKQLLELQIPTLVLGRENETHFIEPPFSFLIQYAIFEDLPLSVDPFTQCRVFMILIWHITCNSGREREVVCKWGYSR
jgi:hypothetical protein